MDIDCGFSREGKWFRYRAAAIIVEDGCILFAKNDVDDYFYSVGGGVHVGETAEEAVVREVEEETGVHYEVDRLALIHENFFFSSGDFLQQLECHEVAFYFLMKPRGTKVLHSNSVTASGVRERMVWIPLEELGRHKAFPAFLPEVLANPQTGIRHIVTRE